MAKFRVTPEELQAASKNIQNNAQQYQSIYHQLLNAAQTMGAAWSGEDNQAYVTQITGLTKDLENMVQHLNQSSDALNKQAANYLAQLNANVANVKSLGQ